MESKFYIGQRVVAIINQPEGDFKKGDIFTVLDIKKGCCSYEIKINNDSQFYRMKCCLCGDIEISTAYFNENSFAPIQEQEISSMTYEDAIELVSEKVNV